MPDTLKANLEPIRAKMESAIRQNIGSADLELAIIGSQVSVCGSRRDVTMAGYLLAQTPGLEFVNTTHYAADDDCPEMSVSIFRY